MIRVITGKAKGYKLKVPKTGTRPLMDRIKTSIFDLIRDFIPDAFVLDLYAGSGAFGIEALSRGAKYADFVDIGNEAIECITENINKTSFQDESKIHQKHVNEFITNTNKTYDIIFLDPPFDDDSAQDLETLVKILKKDGIIIYRSTLDYKFNDHNKILKLAHTQDYGKSRVHFMIKS